MLPGGGVVRAARRSDAALRRLCARAERQARDVVTAIGALGQAERHALASASCMQAEQRVAALSSTYLRTANLICKVQARSRRGIAAKARVTRARLAATIDGRPSPGADVGVWLAWSLTADVLGVAL